MLKSKEVRISELNVQYEECEKIENETWKDMSWLKFEITSKVYFILYKSDKKKW